MQLSYAVVNGHMCGHDVSLFNIVLVTVWCVHESRHQGTESRMQTGGDGLIGNVLRLGCEGLRVEESEASSDHRA